MDGGGGALQRAGGRTDMTSMARAMSSSGPEKTCAAPAVGPVGAGSRGIVYVANVDCHQQSWPQSAARAGGRGAGYSLCGKCGLPPTVIARATGDSLCGKHGLPPTAVAANHHAGEDAAAVEVVLRGERPPVLLRDDKHDNDDGVGNTSPR